MGKKIIAVGDSSTFRSSDIETMRLEATFGAFRNNYLSKYHDQIEWVVIGQRDILTSAPHSFFKFEITPDDIEYANTNKVSFGIYVLTQLKQRILQKINKDPDLIIFSSGTIKDWDDFDTITNKLNADKQRSIRNSITMINTSCCRYDIIVPEIINNLGLAEKPE